MRIRKIAEKKGATDYFRERMNQYGIGYDLARYISEAVFYATKIDKRMAPLLGVIGTRSMNNNLAESDIHELETLSQNLQSISDSDLEIIADELARSVIEHLGYHELLILGSSFLSSGIFNERIGSKYFVTLLPGIKLCEDFLPM